MAATEGQFFKALARHVAAPNPMESVTALCVKG